MNIENYLSIEELESVKSTIRECFRDLAAINAEIEAAYRDKEAAFQDEMRRG